MAKQKKPKPPKDSSKAWAVMSALLREGDAAPLAAYRSDPEVARYQGWDTPYTEAQARELVRAMGNRAVGREGWTQIAVADREEGVLGFDSTGQHPGTRPPRPAEAAGTPDLDVALQFVEEMRAVPADDAEQALLATAVDSCCEDPDLARDSRALAAGGAGR